LEMKNGMKSKYRDCETETSSALNGVIVEVVMEVSGSANNAIVLDVIAAFKSKTELESYSLMTGAKAAAAEDDGVDSGMFFVTNLIVLEVAAVAGDIVKKYVLPSW